MTGAAADLLLFTALTLRSVRSAAGWQCCGGETTGPPDPPGASSSPEDGWEKGHLNIRRVTGLLREVIDNVEGMVFQE